MKGGRPRPLQSPGGLPSPAAVPYHVPMGDTFQKFTVAAVHAASPFLDRDAGVEKACRLIAEAAGKGAKLIAFPETFIPGYPFWIWTHTPAQSGRFFLDFVASHASLPPPVLPGRRGRFLERLALAVAPPHRPPRRLRALPRAAPRRA